jgi:uncharacterized membrane protein
MISRRKFASVAMATTAAALFSAAPMTTAQAGEADVQCYGVNKCKGHNDCKTANNACKGHGSCKGHGFVKMSREACEAIGGSAGKPSS